MWYSPITGKTFPTGHHGSQEVKKGTLKSIIRLLRMIIGQQLKYDMNFNSKKRMTIDESIANQQPVCVLVDESRKPKGVLVRDYIMQENYVIEPHDIADCKSMNFDDAMNLLKSKKLETFRHWHCDTLYHYFGEINDALRSIGGDCLQFRYWTSDAVDEVGAWIFDYYHPSSSIFFRQNKFPIRGVNIVSL